MTTAPLKAVAGLNALALVLVAGSFALPLAQRVGDWNQAQKLKAQQDVSARLTIADLERQREIADAAQDNAIAQFDSLIIYDYVANPADPPHYDWLPVVDPGVPTLIYDKYRACVGLAEGGELTTIWDDPNACKQTRRSQ